jgi:hypothetical protein
MIVFSIGLPSPFADWCDAVVARILRYRAPESREIRGDTLEKIHNGLRKSNFSDAAVFTRNPRRTLRAVLDKAETPIVLSLEDPRKSVKYLMDQHQLSFVPAIRSVSESCAAIADLSPKNVLVLTAQQRDENPNKTIMALIQHICGGQADLAKVFHQIDGEKLATGMPTAAPSGPTSAKLPRSDATKHLQADWTFAPREQLVLDGAFAAYEAFFANRPLEEITWSPDLFCLGGKPAEAPLHAIDVTGRARCLFYGPYMCLPSGPWTVRIFLGFTIDTTIPPFVMEIVIGKHVVVRKVIHPESNGTFELKMDFAVENSDLPVEMRILSERAAFSGQLALGGAILASRGDPNRRYRE